MKKRREIYTGGWTSHGLEMGHIVRLMNDVIRCRGCHSF